MGKRSGINLTKTEIQKLQPGPKLARRWDATTRGLGIQVTPAGIYSWVLSYRLKVSAKKDMIVLGRWPDMTVDQARKAAEVLRVRIDAGGDPKQDKREAKDAANRETPKVITMADLVERYKEKHTPGNSKSWQAGSKRLMDKHILPAMGGLPLAGIGPAQVSDLLFKLRNTKTEARLVRSVLGSMFTRAEEWDLREPGTNPVRIVKNRDGEGTVKRDRRLSDLELKALGQALRESPESTEAKVAIRLALLAGMRKGEIQVARWEWVDLEAAEIRIPADSHKTGRKTGKVRVVHLCAALVEDLEALTQVVGCPYVIPGRPHEDEQGRITWKPYTALQNPWERIRSAAGLAPRTEDGEYADVENNPGLHDLRRTFASVGADLRFKGFVGELLGHAEQTVTDIYTRTGADPLQDAAEAIGGRIAGILDGTIDPEQEALQRRQDRAEKKTTA